MNFYECCDLAKKVHLTHTLATTFIAHMAGHKSFNPSLRPQNYILGNSSRTIQSELKKIHDFSSSYRNIRRLYYLVAYSNSTTTYQYSKSADVWNFAGMSKCLDICPPTRCAFSRLFDSILYWLLKLLLPKCPDFYGNDSKDSFTRLSHNIYP